MWAEKGTVHNMSLVKVGEVVNWAFGILISIYAKLNICTSISATSPSCKTMYKIRFAHFVGCLGLTEVVKNNLTTDQIWLLNFKSIIFLFFCFWLSPTDFFILTFNLLIVIIYQMTKSLISKKTKNRRIWNVLHLTTGLKNCGGSAYTFFITFY